MTVSPIAHHNLVHVPLDRIQEKVVLLRTDYVEESLVELSDSLEEDGILQPVLVAPAENDNYELIVGSRRFRAAKRKGHASIPAFVIEQRSPLNYILMALAENLHREDLNVFEEARAFFRLMTDYGLGVHEVAKNTRKSEHYIRRRIELLSLPEEAQKLVAEKALGLQYVDILAKLPTGEQQVYYAHKVVTGRLAQTELRELIDQDVDEAAHRGTSRRSRRALSADKIRMQLDMFAKWVKRLSHNTALIQTLNADERNAISRSMQNLRLQLRIANPTFTDGSKVGEIGADSVFSNPSNHGEEWSLHHIEMIAAADRPSDEELSKKIGRTVGAIQAMRFKAQSNSKRRKSA